jgi:hypothetical protein
MSKHILAVAIILGALSLPACGSSGSITSSQPQVPSKQRQPEPKVSSNQANEKGSMGQPENRSTEPVTDPQTSTGDAAPPLSGPCLAARTAMETKGIVCSTQGQISFLDLRGASLLDPEKIWLPIGPEGTQVYPTVVRNGELTTLDYTSNGVPKIKFSGANLSVSPPSFGDAVVYGNSGTCAAVRSGTPETCYEVVARNNGSADIVVIPETDMKPTVTFLSDEVPGEWTREGWFRVKEMDLNRAESYCKNLGARLPTPREFEVQGQFESRGDCMLETAYPGRPSTDPVVQEEIRKYHRYEPIWKNVDFYDKGNSKCGLTGEKTKHLGSFWTSPKPGKTPRADERHSYFGYGSGSFSGVSLGYAKASGVVCVK